MVRGRALLLGLAVAAPQAVPAQSAPQGAPQGAPQSAATAAIAASTKADSAALALLERAAKAYQGARTLRAEFTQLLSNPRTRTDLRSKGEFFQKGPALFAFRFTQPAGDRIVSDGQALWLYSPSTARGQVYKMPRAAGMGMDLASSVLKEPAKRYSVTALGDTVTDGRAVKAVQLVPKGQGGGAFTRATLWLDAATALVRRAEFTEASGLVRSLEFINIRTGGSLPRDVFTFVPPAGVRVIDQAAMLGGSVRP